MSVTDRPNSEDKGSWKAITIAITVDKDTFRVAEGEALTFDENDLQELMQVLRNATYRMKADFYGVFGGDVPRKFHSSTLPEPYGETLDED